MYKILEEILNDYKINAYIYDANFFKQLKLLNNDELLDLFLELKEEIKVNGEQKIYSDIAKNNLFRVLSYYRETFNDKDTSLNISELVAFLNKTSSENYEGFLCFQYSMRYLLFEKAKKSMGVISTIEKKVMASINNDHVFLEQLLYDENNFVQKNICSEISFSNLSYLLYIYPDILHDEKLRELITDLLYINLESSDEFFFFHPEEGDLNTSNKLKKYSKKLIKQIDMYTR